MPPLELPMTRAEIISSQERPETPIKKTNSSDFLNELENEAILANDEQKEEGEGHGDSAEQGNSVDNPSQTDTQPAPSVASDESEESRYNRLRETCSIASSAGGSLSKHSSPSHSQGRALAHKGLGANKPILENSEQVGFCACTHTCVCVSHSLII